MKIILENALEREKHLVEFIEKLCGDHLSFLTKKFEKLAHSDMVIKEDAERLRMRNEELETRLLNSQSKLWTLKLLYDDYDKIIHKMIIQKNENNYIYKENRSELLGAVDEFLSSHGVPRKKGRSIRSKSILASNKSGRSLLRKKPSVRFQKSSSRGSDHAIKASILRKSSSIGNGVSLRKSRSNAVRLQNMNTDSEGCTPNQRSAIIRNNLANTARNGAQTDHFDQRSFGIQSNNPISPSHASAANSQSSHSPSGLPVGPRNLSQSRNNDQRMNRAHTEGFNINAGILPNRNYDDQIIEQDNEEELLDQNYNDELDHLYGDDYSLENEEEEDEDDENLEVHTVFEEANDYIEDLKRKLKISLETNSSNEQTIESLRKELAELQKINDRLEQELYKYQYDVNRITDVLLNDAYPTKEELEQEEKAIVDISEQENHLYTLLKRGAELRKKQTDSDEKIKVYENDIEELMNKNKNLQEIEHIKNELSNNLEFERCRNGELEAILDDKTRSFHILLEEKDDLFDNLNKIQAEKDELKTTLDTLHQLRDQEEEEIEKTLDEAKSIIQKLEEKLHNKDEKIKKYKEKVSNIERERSDFENRLMVIEDEFKDKEKNMKLKLLWAQMEKKDLATTILKLENSAHMIHQSDIKGNVIQYERSFDDRRRNSNSEEKATANRSRHNPDLKRNSEAYHRRESIDEARSGSRNRTSLRRKQIEREHIHHMHERSKSAISLDSQGPKKITEFHLHNQAMPD